MKFCMKCKHFDSIFKKCKHPTNIFWNINVIDGSDEFTYYETPKEINRDLDCKKHEKISIIFCRLLV